MDDYRVNVTVKNNYFIAAMGRAGIKTVAELSRMSGVTQQELGRLINLKRSPYNQDGELRTSVQRVCDILGASVADLFPPQHLYSPLLKNTASLTLPLASVKNIIQGGQNVLQLASRGEGEDAVWEVLTSGQMKGRTVEMIKMRHGLGEYGGKEHTLQQIASHFGLSNERVRQIIHRAYHELRGNKLLQAVALSDHEGQID